MKKLLLAALAALFALGGLALAQQVSPAPGTGGGSSLSFGPNFTNAGGQINLTQPINSITTTSYTINALDGGAIDIFNNASAIAVTLPAATTAGFTDGFSVGLQNVGAGTVTVTTTSPLYGAFTSSTTLVMTTGESCKITSKTVSGTASYLISCGAARGTAGGGLVGTFPNPTLANPSASTLGGIESIASVSHNWINSISTSGVPALSQPATTDLSDIGTFNLNTTGTATAAYFVSPPSTPAISTSTFTPVAAASNTYRVVLVHASCPCTIANPSGSPADGTKILLEVWQSATGSDIVGTWGTSYDFGVGGTPTLSTGANKGDYLGFSYSAKNSKWNYLGIQQGF